MAVTNIRDLPSPWRTRLLPAHFDGFLFHCEAGSRENGRRIVTHEFPKKELPYSEDMGKRATEFSVRGYIIQFVTDTGSPLYQRDYTFPRDALQSRLEEGRSGNLQLPLQFPMLVRCSRYRLTEEDRLGGYCVFDMSFVELGAPPFAPSPSSYQNLVQQSQNLRAEVLAAITSRPG
jgi:prophage DNA circulation protein